MMLNRIRADPRRWSRHACWRRPSPRRPPHDRRKVDYDAMYRIKDEGFQRSQVMDTASWLTDVYGARLTGSPEHQGRRRLGGEEADRVGRPERAPRDLGRRSATAGRTSASRRRSSRRPRGRSSARPKAWTPGHRRRRSRPRPCTRRSKTRQDLERWKGKLKGKIVLADADARGEGVVRSAGDAVTPTTDLKKLEEVDPTGGPRAELQPRRCSPSRPKRLQFLADEGVLAVLEPSRGGDGGTIFVQQGGAYNPKAPQTYVRYPEKSADADRARRRALRPASRACSTRTCRCRSS